MNIEVNEAIEHGMKWLDKEHPGWELELDLGTLDLGSTCACVLGQLEGNFWDACNSRHVTPKWAAWRGFIHPDYRTEAYVSNAKYEVLTEAWRDAIKDRLNAGIEV